MTFKRIIAGISLVLVASTLAACGGSTIDDKSVAKQIVEAQKKVTPDLKVNKGKCPSDIEAKKGAKFKCTVNVAGVKAPYNVKVTSIKGDDVVFDFEPAKAIIGAEITQGFIEQQAAAQGFEGATADCGEDAVIVSDPKDTFKCTLSLGTDQTEVEILVKDIEGNIEIVQ